jgi:hypothetical protein
MPDILKGILTGILCPALALLTSLLISAAVGLGFSFNALAVVGLIAGVLYGLEAAILVIYDLSGWRGWVQLSVDMTWSLLNTVFGLVFGNLIYILIGNPSRGSSSGQGWIVFLARGTGTFGTRVLQTLGTVNLGGAGAHEKVHVLQARVFGPLYLSIYAVDYALNFIAQCLWCATLGWILKVAGKRSSVSLEPPGSSVIGGFFGWIYAATVFEMWAYETEGRGTE